MQLKNTLPTFATVVFVSLASIAGAQGTAQKPDPKATAAQDKPKSGNPITDGWITMKIHSQFIPENVLEGSDIDVDTNAGVVTLSGTVPNAAARERAVAIAKATDGVKSVSDSLKIAPAVEKAAGTGKPDTSRETAGTAKAAGRSVNDGWIKSKVYAQFLTEDALEDSDIDVDVRDGNVTLNGTVASDSGRTRAVAIAKATDGVKGVKDALKVVKK
jgi:hyperosmotically inducible periplasmic protein